MNIRSTRISAFQNDVTEYAPDNSVVYGLRQINRQDMKTRVNNLSSPWIEILRDRFDELVSLPVGWDGYNGRPVSFTCAQFAANLIESLCDDGLPPPSLVPGSDGTLQIEWHRNQYDIEIDVLAPYQVVATRFDHQTAQQQELDLTSDFTIIASWLSELKTNGRAAA